MSAAAVCPEHEQKFESLSDLQEQLVILPEEATAFFKSSLFQNISAEQSSLSAFFSDYILLLVKNNKLNFFQRVKIIFSFQAFRTLFLEILRSDIQRHRGPWLLSHCDARELFGADLKSTHHHFQIIETKNFLSYIQPISTIDKWVRNEYKRVRAQFLFTLLQKNSHLILFWTVVVCTFLFCLAFTLKDRPFTLAQIVRTWVKFVF